MIRITIYSGPSATDARPIDVSQRVVDQRDVTEELRQIGLEWRTSDYMVQRQAVITLDPVSPVEDELQAVQQDIRDAAASLERTGLL